MIKGIAVLTSRNIEKNKEKAEFAFRVYDWDNNGFISNGDMYNVLTQMLCMNSNLYSNYGKSGGG